MSSVKNEKSVLFKRVYFIMACELYLSFLERMGKKNSMNNFMLTNLKALAN